MRHSKTRVLAAALISVLLIGVLLLQWRPDRNRFFPSVPIPNGYENFKQAALRLRGEPVDPATSTEAELAAFVRANGESLTLIKSGLQLPCAVPVEFSENYLGSHMNDLAGLKKLSRALVNAGTLAEREGRNDEALAWYLDDVRFAQNVARSGIFIDALMVHPLQAAGLKSARHLAAKLPRVEIERAIQELETIEQKRESFGEILNRERVFARKTFGWWRVFAVRMASLFSKPLRQSTTAEPVENSVMQATAQLRLTILSLALEDFRQKNGHFPNGLSEVTGAVSPRELEDPFSGKNLIYRLQQTNFLLYSVGPDRIDDSGKRLVNMRTGNRPIGDLLAE